MGAGGFGAQAIEFASEGRLELRRKKDADYVLGTSNLERDRLRAQGDAVGPLTERLFRQAGIRPGLRVLDLGCGTGDVSLLVARMVGGQGEVVGVDHEAGGVNVALLVFGA